MDRGQALAVWLLCFCGGLRLASGITRADLFSYGYNTGDLILAEGDDETSKVLTLPRPLYFYDTSFMQLYVATNGIISAQDLPMEKQYVDDGFPTDFPVVAPFLADIDTSNGQGQIYYRVTETPRVLNRLAREVHRGFPDAKFVPTHAVVATWENVAAYEDDPKRRPSNKVNTFQAVIGYDETDSYVVFLYPGDGLNFFGTRPKESYNVEIELPARVGFSRGEVAFFLFTRTEGPHYSVTSDEQSVKNLHQVGNTGIPGIWLFHTGNRYSFGNIVPASFGGLLATPPPQGYEFGLDSTTPEYAEFEEYSDATYSPDEVEDDEYPLTNAGPFEPAAVEEAPSGPVEPALARVPFTESTEDLPVTEPSERPEVAPRLYAPPPPSEDTRNQPPEQPQVPLEVIDVYPPPPSNPHLSPGGYVVSVDEDDVDFDTGVIQYTTENKETCARFQQQCSQNAVCSDYATGFCCRCKSGFFGNGRQCLPDGAPQRVSGKVSGSLLVGSSPVSLDHVDLHAYIVVGDGRAYTAISKVPASIGWALMPASPIGELFGWLFALELPNSQAGFKITGAEFTRHAEVVFYPGNERLSIIQTGRGLDEQNHLTVDTVVNGNVPAIPVGAEVTMDPFKEVYQYYPSVATSTSVREFTVVSAERGSESFSFQLKQNITFRDCRHDSRSAPETLQITMERVFMMYVKEERILRYAITNKISPVGVEPSGPDEVNPCYSGTHDCDTTAQCVPQEGQDFECKCATGYTGDGRNCYDIDECVESSSSCGAHSQCVNLPGSHRCQCQKGYEFGFDGRTCVDIDECIATPCNHNAKCTNSLGTFHCQCHSGYFGDGFSCTQDGQTERPKSHCEQHRDNLQSGLDQGVGAFVPQCEADGRYRPLQCHGSTGHCWCVDSRGQERPGTRAPPGTSPTDCDRPDEPVRHKTQCEHHRDSVETTSPEGYPILGAHGLFVPECEADGQYKSLQCHGSTGHCWCVDSAGQEQPGTRTTPGSPTPDCNNPSRVKTRCEHHRDSVQTTSPEGYPTLGAYVPQCDAQGQYLPQQCLGSTGHCWCVDSTGQEKPGTRTPPGADTHSCSHHEEPTRPKTHCEHHRDSVRSTSPEGYPILGAFVPECDTYGQYTPQQCHGSTGHCWCVDSNGQERPGTRTPPGTPSVDCTRPVVPERQKTPCEYHRDSVHITSPHPHHSVGDYVPQCDANGAYLSQQCHGSSGQCWCVDSAGQEKPGTRSAAGSPSHNCSHTGDTVNPKTRCEQHRDSVQTTSPEGYPIIGLYVPQCDADGQYSAQQCHGSIGHCWCVDHMGLERLGSRTGPGTLSVDCSEPVETVEPARPKSHCEHHRDRVQSSSPEGYPVIGAYVPQCDSSGQYIPLQCHGSTGHCWCVDSTGQERAGTRTSPGSPPVDCDRPVEPSRPVTRCEHHRDSVQTTTPEEHPGVGAYVPQCDQSGQYSSQQCHGSTGHCWCVDSTGQERPGTRSAPGTQRVDCDRPAEPSRPKTQCEHHRDSVQTTTPEGQPVSGAYVPQCDQSGQYSSQQCHGSSGHCWCVDSTGQERPGTRSAPGTQQVDCDRPAEPSRPITRCEHHRDSVQTTTPEGRPALGAYVPQCDQNGQYSSQQCHGSTGHCWCVDSTGQERPGTRSTPGTYRVDCDQPEAPTRPKTQCEHHRDSVQTSTPDGRPLLGAYVPQCDESGQYTIQQCHGSSGDCWCVDSTGQERPGTRRPAGTQQVDCSKPDQPQRPKTYCEHHRDSVQTTSTEGYPTLGAYVPQCDAEGQYIPQQCHGSNGDCWCVDSTGQERPGSRTGPGVASKDCSKPDEPARPKTHCEHHRDSVQSQAEGRPMVGAYVPQCDTNGQYVSKQCHVSTGHCWCVDINGRERAGTRTPPGTPRVDCYRPVPAVPTRRPESVCERWRASLIEHYGGKPEPQQYLPQCEPDGQFSPVQCYGETTFCWCVDQDGREVPGTRSHDVVKPACLPSVAPPTVRPLPRPNVTPPPDAEVTLLYAQGQKIGALPLDGTKLDGNRSKTLLTLHGSIVVGIAYDCKENHVYWTDLSARTINRASMVPGAEPEILISSNLVSPEGLAVDSQRRRMFWVDSSPDLIETSNLDGSGRRILFDKNLVNPRAIIVVPSTGTLYWTDWNREAPKIEAASVDGENRRVVVSEGIGLPNALTYDSSAGLICWADAGTKRLECIRSDGSGRKVIHPNLNYPFSMVYYRQHFYFSDWRRDGVITVSKETNKLTDEYLPEQRSHLYGIAIASTQCLSGIH